MQDGTAPFYPDPEAPPQFNEPGASLVQKQDGLEAEEADTMDLPRYINEHVGKRCVDPTRPTTVVMKLDIEGYEHELYPALIVSGAVCNHVDSIFDEMHPWGRVSYGGVEDTTFVKFFYDFIESHKQQCDLTVEYVDDESYDTSFFPLPD